MSGCGPEDSASVQIAVIHYYQQAHKCKSCIRDIFHLMRKNSMIRL